ncbi:matrixin family metalloprotease [Sorangium sp. So ce854]|uniref:matrixin family metalloprotease n=1 Tax=Sorangium sp. So ce854 TaxID=3133322 RepID=UPI003F60E309
MVSRRALLATAGLLSAGALTSRLARAAGPAAAPVHAFPLSIAVAEDEAGAPVRDEAWVDAQVAEAARLFEPAGVALRKVASRALPPRLARVETREDRDALAAAIEARRINVMVVASLRDVDDPRRFRMGVHWRRRATPERRCVILSASALPTVLAHELGHFFGLGHSGTEDNVMSYTRTGAPVFFDAAQIEKIRTSARRYAASKALDPA